MSTPAVFSAKFTVEDNSEILSYSQLTRLGGTPGLLAFSN